MASAKRPSSKKIDCMSPLHQLVHQERNVGEVQDLGIFWVKILSARSRHWAGAVAEPQLTRVTNQRPVVNLGRNVKS